MKNQLLPALMLLLGGAAASAQTTAVLDYRSSITYVTFGGGFATAGTEGTDGSLSPSGLAEPAFMRLDDQVQYSGTYLGWAVDWQANWQVQQDWAIDTAARRITGSGSSHLFQTSTVTGPGCPNCAASVLVTAKNWQQLEFDLSASSPYSFHVEGTGGLGVQINRWDLGQQRWLPFALNTLPTWDRSGVMSAGRYQVVNSKTTGAVTGSDELSDQSWLFSLTLPEASISAVPEPGAWLLLAGGLPLLLRRARTNTRPPGRNEHDHPPPRSPGCRT